jgi:hypothetical protein
MCTVYALDSEPQGILFYIFIAICLYTIYREIMHAANIKSDTDFILSLILSLVALVGVSVLTTIIIINNEIPKIYILFGSTIIVLDAIVSPSISFKMARRSILTINDI